jgi:hypothetical protein
MQKKTFLGQQQKKIANFGIIETIVLVLDFWLESETTNGAMPIFFPRMFEVRGSML